MHTKIWLSLTVLLMASTSWSAPDTNVTVVKKPNNQVVQDTSEFHRMNIDHQLLAGMGSSVAPTWGGSLAYAYQFDRKNAIQIEASSGDYPLILLANLKTTMTGVHYKRYVGNSFYFRTGLDARSIILEDRGLFSVNSGREFGRTTDLTAAFVIGNQWQWETFTLGTDWVGVNVPITNLSQNIDYSGLNANDKAEIKKSWDKLGQVTSVQYLRFYLGASF